MYKKIITVVITGMLALTIVCAAEDPPEKDMPGKETKDNLTDSEIMSKLKELRPKFYEYLVNLKEKSPEDYNAALDRIKRRSPRHQRKPFNDHSKYENPESEILRKEIKTLTREYHMADDGEKDNIKKKIKEKASEAFDITTDKREKMIEDSGKRLEEAKARLDKAKEMLKNRKEKREVYIDSFINKILEEK